MNNGNEPINPTNVQQVGNEVFRPIRDNDPKEHNVSFLGLTKREYFAAMAMQGLMSNSKVMINDMDNINQCVLIADELLKQLEVSEDVKSA